MSPVELCNDHGSYYRYDKNCITTHRHTQAHTFVRHVSSTCVVVAKSLDMMQSKAKILLGGNFFVLVDNFSDTTTECSPFHSLRGGALSQSMNPS